MAKTKGDPKRTAFVETLLQAFGYARRKNPGHWQAFFHWDKHELVDNPAKFVDVVAKDAEGKEVVTRKHQKMPVIVEGVGRVEVWRKGGDKPDKAMTDLVDGVTWYGFETDCPHDVTQEDARALMATLFAKFGV